MSIATPPFAGAELDEMIATRRDLHAHPEVGFEEVRTSGLVAQRLRALGLEWEVAAIRQDRADVTASGVVVVPDATTQATIVLRRR